MKRRPDTLADMKPHARNATLQSMLYDALEACERVTDPVARIGAIAKARELLAELAAEAAAAVEAEETARKNAAPPGVDQTMWDALRAGDPLALARVSVIGVREALPTFDALPADERLAVYDEIIATATAARDALLPPVDPFANARPLLRVVPGVIEPPANGVSNGGPTS